MSDVEVDESFVRAVDVLVDAEAARRDTLRQLWFHELATRLLQFREHAAAIAAMLRAQLGTVAEQHQQQGDGNDDDDDAAAVRARALAGRHADERAALEAYEDVCGRRRVLLDEAEQRERLWLTARSVELARCIVEAFAPCVTQSYSHAWDVRVHHVLPLRPHALDRLGKNAERHVPPHMRRDARLAAAACARTATATSTNAAAATTTGSASVSTSTATSSPARRRSSSSSSQQQRQQPQLLPHNASAAPSPPPQACAMAA